MKLEQQLLINRNEVRTTTIDQQGMKLTTTIDQQGMKLAQQLLINREWSTNNNYWSTTGNEVKTTIIDQQGMKLGQQLLINRESSYLGQ